MKNNDLTIASEVIKILKQSIRRIYAILIITIVLFIISIVDSIIQREKINDLINSYDEIVEETHDYNMETDNGDNFFVGGDNNGKVKGD